MKTNRKPPKATPTATAPTPATPETAVTSSSALSWFTQVALLIPLVTIVGAWYVLIYETGYLSYFHIPYYFISLSPSIVLGTSFVLVELLVSVCLFGMALIFGIIILGSLDERLKKKRKERNKIIYPLVLNCGMFDTVAGLLRSG